MKLSFARGVLEINDPVLLFGLFALEKQVPSFVLFQQFVFGSRSDHSSGKVNRINWEIMPGKFFRFSGGFE